MASDMEVVFWIGGILALLVAISPLIIADALYKIGAAHRKANDVHRDQVRLFGLMYQGLLNHWSPEPDDDEGEEYVVHDRPPGRRGPGYTPYGDEPHLRR